MKPIKLFIAGLLILSFFSCDSSPEDQQNKFTAESITVSNNNAMAEIESGKVTGYIENGIYIYKGIPCAEAERFMPSHPPLKGEGIRSNRAYGPVCPQEKTLPRREPYFIEKGAAMIFNNECKIKYSHDKELLELINSFSTI